MKKMLYGLCILLFAGYLNNLNAQTAHKIAIQFYATATNVATVELYADTITEGQVYTIQQKTLPSSYSGAQGLYDALVGTEFYFQTGSLDTNIVVSFYISDIDLSTGGYANQGSIVFFFDVNFSISDWNGVIFQEPFNLNSGKYAILKIYKTAAFNSFIAKTGLDINAALKFAYESSANFDLNGIKTYDSTSSVTAMISHFSHIVGSNASSVTAVEENPVANNVPSELILKQNYPNPFNPSTKIDFSLPARSFVQLNVYNVLGVKVATLVNGTLNAGSHAVEFNPVNLSSGLYIYELKSNNMTLSRKMLYMK